MITENYVSFEVAKLLKEKGFDENTNCQYPVGGIHIGEVGEYNITDRSRNHENYIPAPTLQMTMKWLRQTYKLQVIIYPFDCEDGIFWAYKIFSIEQECLEVNRSDTRVGYNSYEQSCEAAIQYCLQNLI